MLGICDRVAEDAELARLAFFEVLELGRPGVRWRAALIGELARGFRAGSSGEERPTELASEASLGAVWSLMHYMVNTGRRRELPHLADSFAFLLLAPPLGAPAAVEVLFKIDDDASYGCAVRIMDVCKGAGAKTLGIVTKEP